MSKPTTWLQQKPKKGEQKVVVDPKLVAKAQAAVSPRPMEKNPRRARPGAVALREIRSYQKQQIG
jgi:hypothetical protein